MPLTMLKVGSNVYLLAFFILGIIQVSSEALSIDWLADSSKVLLMPFLALHVKKHRNASEGYLFVLLLAIGFSWLGDVLLIRGQDETFFLLGMLAFFMAHAFYLVTYRKAGMNFRKQLPLKVALILIASIVGILIMSYLSPGLGELKPYVFAYAAMIITMLVGSVLRLGGTSDFSFGAVFAGALLFVLSDSIIGYSKFVAPLEYGHCYVMVTYILAQAGIVVGLTR